MTTKFKVVLTVACLTLAVTLVGALPVLAASQGPRVLINTPINEAQLVTLVGNTRFEANARNDRGRVPDNFQLNHMLLQLRRPVELEDAFSQYIETLTDKSSPNFRHWMPAAEQGRTYGVAQQDIDSITNWLRSQGLTVGYVYPSHMVIDFSGTAGQIRNAFHTEIHNLNVRGEKHYANMGDPKIPAALAPAVIGVVSMHDFKPQAHHEMRSDFTLGGGYYALVPADFQTIYNVNPLYTEGITGKGQTVALVESTNSYGNDWASYQSTFGLTSYGGTFTTVHPNSAGNCSNPGTNGADVEADLDVEMVTAVAPGANVELISCSDTATFGGLIAVQNIVNAGNPPAVMSMSYGLCEVGNGAASNAAFNAAFQSAAAAGVSVFVSAGDNGPSGCAEWFAGGDGWAYPGIGVTGWGETPYNVSVGGTDFEEVYNAIEGGPSQSTYWSSTNSATYGSALSYIPEMPWNDSCSSFPIYYVEGFSIPYGPYGDCNTGGYVSTVAGAGGPSSCATGTGNPDYLFSEDSTCKGYAKPSWQKKIFGNPKDGTRDIPDVSLFAANGVWGHFVMICYSDRNYGGVPCTGSPANWVGLGGTSASSPLMAAIQALVNQKWSARVGNPNPTYYSIAATEFGKKGNSSCYSANAAPGNKCSFYDITQGDNSITCVANGDVYSADCYLDNATYGSLSTQAISSVAVTAGGSGYTGAPKCTIDEPTNNSAYFSPEGVPIYFGGARATCTATVSNGAVSGITVTFPGAGYTGNPICNLSGGGGKGAKCQAIIDPTVAADSYQPAFGAAPGWDFATGLGSVNAYNLVNNTAW